MIPNAFIDRTEAPTDADLAAELGPAKVLWDQLVEDMAKELGVTVQEWNSYSRKAGWSLRLKRGKRNILYLSPCRGCFRVMFILGDKAVGAARVCGDCERILQLIDEAPRYPEGTGIRLDVTGPEDIPVIKALARIKLEH